MKNNKISEVRMILLLHGIEPLYIYEIKEGVYRTAYENDNQLILKIFNNNWHINEYNFYKKFANSPIFSSDIFIGGSDIQPNPHIILRDISRNFHQIKKHSHSTISMLAMWVQIKHQYFKNHPDLLLLGFETKLKWMVYEPFITISRFILSQELFNSIKIFCDSAKDFIVSINLPANLDHNDLEIQNIFINNSSTEILCVDWTNSITSFGLFDIAQLRKEVIQGGLFDSQKTVINLCKKLDIQTSVKEILFFSIVKELMLLHYHYQSNNSTEITIDTNYLQNLSHDLDLFYSKNPSLFEGFENFTAKTTI